MELHVNGTNSITATREIEAEDWGIRFEAADIYRARTGIHAKIVIARNQTILAWGQINIDKDEQRTRLAGKAYRGLSQIQQDAYSRTNFAHDLDMFCYGLWDASLDTSIDEPSAGLATETAPPFRLKPFILQGGGTILFGPPKRGKSYATMLMAVSIDAGNSMLWPVTKGRVLFLNLERSHESLLRRLGAVNLALGEDMDRPLLIMTRRGRALEDIVDTATKAIQKYDIDTVFLDSISRTGAGDLNANETSNEIVDTLSNLCPTWLAIGHTPRADSTHIYGSVHYEAGADIMVRLMSEEKKDALGVGLRITDANDIGSYPIMALEYGFDEFGLAEVRKSAVSEFPSMDEALPHKDRISNYLKTVGRASVAHIAESTGLEQASIRTTVNRYKGKIFTKIGNSDDWGVLTQPEP